jgi:hypothetical protein
MNNHASAATPGLPIASVERETGLSKDTLRVWERRYGFPTPERDANGGLQSNDGTFVLDWAYGGVRLSRMCAGGGERDISGRGTVRECYTYISAMLAGIALVEKQA